MLEIIFPVRRGERGLTFALFLHSLAAVGAFLTGRTVRDTLFLAYGDRSMLAWMYVFSAVGVTAAGLVYSRLAARIRRDQMALVSASLFGAGFLFFWVAQKSQAAWVYPCPLRLRRSDGRAGAGAVLDAGQRALQRARGQAPLRVDRRRRHVRQHFHRPVVGARVATPSAPALLLLCAVLLLRHRGGASFGGGRLGRSGCSRAPRAASRAAAKRTGGGAARVLADSHLRTVALLAAVTFFTTTLVDFEFKVVAADAYTANELAAFFGYFSAVVGVLALGLQLFGTSRLLQRAGVVGALAVLPLSLMAGNLALAIFPLLWAASMAKGADTLFRYSVNDATTQILYLPVPAQARASAKAFIDSVVKPMAIGLSGLFLAGYKAWSDGSPAPFAWVSVLLTMGWLAVVASLRSHYIKSLQDNLKNRRLGPRVTRAPGARRFDAQGARAARSTATTRARC